MWQGKTFGKDHLWSRAAMRRWTLLVCCVSLLLAYSASELVDTFREIEGLESKIAELESATTKDAETLEQDIGEVEASLSELMKEHTRLANSQTDSCADSSRATQTEVKCKFMGDASQSCVYHGPVCTNGEDVILFDPISKTYSDIPTEVAEISGEESTRLDPRTLEVVDFDPFLERNFQAYPLQYGERKVTSTRQVVPEFHGFKAVRIKSNFDEFLKQQPKVEIVDGAIALVSDLVGGVSQDVVDSYADELAFVTEWKVLSKWAPLFSALTTYNDTFEIPGHIERIVYRNRYKLRHPFVKDFMSFFMSFLKSDCGSDVECFSGNSTAVREVSLVSVDEGKGKADGENPMMCSSSGGIMIGYQPQLFVSYGDAFTFRRLFHRAYDVPNALTKYLRHRYPEFNMTIFHSPDGEGSGTSVGVGAYFENLSEIKSLLREFKRYINFDVVDPREMSTEELTKLLDATGVVLSPGGFEGLATLLLRGSAAMVEVFPYGVTPRIHAAYAIMSGTWHFPVLSKSLGKLRSSDDEATYSEQCEPLFNGGKVSSTDILATHPQCARVLMRAGTVAPIAELKTALMDAFDMIGIRLDIAG